MILNYKQIEKISFFDKKNSKICYLSIKIAWFITYILLSLFYVTEIPLVFIILCNITEIYKNQPSPEYVYLYYACILAIILSIIFPLIYYILKTNNSIYLKCLISIIPGNIINYILLLLGLLYLKNIYTWTCYILIVNVILMVLNGFIILLLSKFK